MKSIRLFCLLAGLPVLALADPFPAPPAVGALPGNGSFGQLNDPILTSVMRSMKGVRNITWKAYCERASDGTSIGARKRIPTWYTVEIPNPDSGKEMTVDLYDVGLQGKNHAVRFRVVGTPGATFWLLEDNGQASTGGVIGGPGFADLGASRYLPGSGNSTGKPRWDKIGVIKFRGARLLIECYRTDDDRSMFMMQPDDGAPPPPNSGSEH